MLKILPLVHSTVVKLWIIREKQQCILAHVHRQRQTFADGNVDYQLSAIGYGLEIKNFIVVVTHLFCGWQTA